MKNLLLFALAFLAAETLSAQPCTTQIFFDNLQDDAYCSSLQPGFTIEVYPKGGTFSGANVTPNGYLDVSQLSTGSYWIYYTAADSCGTMDSVEISVLATASELTQTQVYDCSLGDPVQVEALELGNEEMILNFPDGNVLTVNGFEQASLADANPLMYQIFLSTTAESCSGMWEVLHRNAPRPSAEVEYDCAENQATLRWVNPDSTARAVWRQFDQTIDDIRTPYRFGESRRINRDTGNYALFVTYANGCEGVSTINAPQGFPIVPSVNAGSYTTLGCRADPQDSLSLLGAGGPGPVNYHWSLPGGIFPGDSTLRLPQVPQVPNVYELRAENQHSGCFSVPDTTIIRAATLDTTEVSAVLCEGQAFYIIGLTFDVPGLYTLELLDSDGCDSTVLLELIGLPPLEPEVIVTGPDASGVYTITIDEQSGQTIQTYTWPDGSSTSSNTYMTTQTGTQVASVVSIDGCEQTVSFSVGTSGIADELTKALSVFPNPVEDVLQWTYGGEAQLIRIELIGLNGAIRWEANSAGLLSGEIPTRELEPGVYLVKWIDARGATATKRVMKR